MERRKNKVPCFCSLCNGGLVSRYTRRKHAQSYEGARSSSLIEHPELDFEHAYARDIHGQSLKAGTIRTEYTFAPVTIEDPILTAGTGNHNSTPSLPESMQTDNHELPMLPPESLQTDNHEVPNPLSPLPDGTDDNLDDSPSSPLSQSILDAVESHLVCNSHRHTCIAS